jgi:hypothetical protein
MLLFTELRTYLNEEAKENEWEKENPVDHMNIVNHYNEATKDERHGGRVWYKHANQIARDLSNAHGVSVDKVAGLLSAYSPQTNWYHNIIHAARVVKRKLGVGGTGGTPDNPKYFPAKGGTPFATGGKKEWADRILSGEHHSSVLKGFKTGAFARLIEHGGNTDDSNPEVVVDRHAYSVATGSRVSDDAFGKAGLGGKRKYDMVKDAYIRAAAHINDQNGAKRGDAHYLHPHQIQAITWLVRQRKNDAEDGVPDSNVRQRGHWGAYAGTWMPGSRQYFKEDILRLVENYKRSM